MVNHHASACQWLHPRVRLGRTKVEELIFCFSIRTAVRQTGLAFAPTRLEHTTMLVRNG